MFKFTSLHTDLERVKFDAVSQALASSQTLVSSFRNVVIGLVNKLINNDSLIKGQHNGPDLAAYNIDDAVNQLKLMKDQYVLNLDVLYKNRSTAFHLLADQAEIKAIVAGMSPCSTIMDLSSGPVVYNHPWWVSKFNATLDDSPVDFILNLIAYPKMKFYPSFANTQMPTLSNMYYLNSNLNSAVDNIYQDFWCMRTLPHDNRPMWISILPLLQSSQEAGSIAPGTSFMTLSNYTFDISGNTWYTNAYLIQMYEYQATGSSTYNVLQNCGIVVTASTLHNDVVETKSWFKTTRSVNVMTNSSAEGYKFNSTWQCLSRLHALEFAAMSSSNTPMMYYNQVFDCFTTSYQDIIAKYLESWRDKGSGTGYYYTDYLSHIGNTLTSNDHVIFNPRVASIPITTTQIEQDGKVVFSDLKADIPDITGDVTAAMTAVINDLSSYTYDS